jgi:hypothetical protein
VLASNGYPVSPGLRTRLTQLQLRALEAAHPHAYKVRLLRDDLAVAVTARREAERYARSLEEQLAERERRIIELAEDATRQSAAWGSEYERLTEEIEQLTTQLAYATQRAAAAERRCAGLGSLLEHVDQTQPDEHQERDHLRSVDWDSAVSNLPLDDLNAVDHFLSVLLRLALRDQAETLANRVVTHITREQHSTRNITKRDGVLGLLATMRAEGLYDQANQLSTWMGFPTNHSERRAAPYNYSPSIS